MSVKVVDASALCALLFGEPQAEAVANTLSGARLAAPALLPFEVTNIAVNKIKRHPDLRAALLTASALLDLPTGATVACVFGLLLLLWSGLARPLRRRTVMEESS